MVEICEAPTHRAKYSCAIESFFEGSEARLLCKFSLNTLAFGFSFLLFDLLLRFLHRLGGGSFCILFLGRSTWFALGFGINYLPSCLLLFHLADLLLKLLVTTSLCDASILGLLLLLRICDLLITVVG